MCNFASTHLISNIRHKSVDNNLLKNSYSASSCIDSAVDELITLHTLLLIGCSFCRWRQLLSAFIDTYYAKKIIFNELIGNFFFFYFCLIISTFKNIGFVCGNYNIYLKKKTFSRSPVQCILQSKIRVGFLF